MPRLGLACVLVFFSVAEIASAHGLGWAVGRRGAILHSGSTGATWVAQSSGSTADLYGVDFTPWRTGIAVGDAGTVLYSSDGGASWNPGTSGTSADLRAVAFRDVRNAVAVGSGGTILSTRYGGKWWSAETSGTPVTLHDVTFVDADHGWAVGGFGEILHTTDGGDTWTPQTSGTTTTLVAVDFVDPDTGWVVGWDNIVRHTSDGGSTWTSQTIDDVYELTGVDFIDASSGWVSSRYEGLYRTVDGGASWTAHPPIPEDESIYQLRDVAFVSDDIGTAVGISHNALFNPANPNPAREVLHSRTGGWNWTPHPTPAADLEAVAFVPHDEHGVNPDACRTQCSVEFPNSCEEQPRSAFRSYEDELPDFIDPGPFSCAGGWEVQIIEGQCANGQVVFLYKNYGIGGVARYYDATTRALTALRDWTDIEVYPCGSSSYWPGPIACPDATVTAVHCGTAFEVDDPVYTSNEGTIPVEGAFVYPEDVPALSVAGALLLAGGVAASALRRLRRPRAGND